MATTIGPNEMLVGGALVAIGLFLFILKVKSTAARAVLGVLLGLLVFYGVTQYRRVRSIPSTSGGQAVTYFADPKILVDEDVAVGARGSQARKFSLQGTDALQVVAEAKGPGDKSFILHVMAPDDFEAFTKKKPSRYAPAFEALATSVSRIDVLPPGSYVVVIDNSQNGSAITVHVRVVVNPS